MKQHWVWTLASVKVQKSDLKKANVYKAEWYSHLIVAPFNVCQLQQHDKVNFPFASLTLNFPRQPLAVTANTLNP